MLCDLSRPHGHDILREVVKQLLSQLVEDGKPDGRETGEVEKICVEIDLHDVSFYRVRLEAAIKAKAGGQWSPLRMFYQFPVPK